MADSYIYWYLKLGANNIPISEDGLLRLIEEAGNNLTGTVMYEVGTEPQVGDRINNCELLVAARVMVKPGSVIDRTVGTTHGMILLVR